MFAATITLTISGVATVLNRVNQDSYGSEYQYSGSLSSVSMKIRHSLDPKDKDGVSAKRHNVYVERIVFPTATAPLYKQTSTMTIRGGQYEDPTLAAALTKAVVVWANTGANIDDLSVGVN